MNIIKLLDKIKKGDSFFNKKLKGRYAYFVRCMYVIPFDEITENDYYRLERGEEVLPVIDSDDSSDDSDDNTLNYRIVDTLTDYVDHVETSKINDINKYIVLNKFASDEDITIDELKKFRTWLATTLLSFDLDIYDQPKYELFDDKTTHMLQYYAEEMTDDICKYLQMYGVADIQLVSQATGCGCGSTPSYSAGSVQVAKLAQAKSSCGCDGSSLYSLGDVNVCDPIGVYRKNVYAKMVATFASINFWTQFSKKFIEEFKKYIDNIIENNFSLVTSDYVTSYAECNCLSEKNIEQLKNIGILKELSKSLGYIYNDEIDGHRNSIADSLMSWSSILYEKMRW